MRKSRRRALLADRPARMQLTPALLAAAEDFVLRKWRERAEEKGLPQPSDLSGACKFSSQFVQLVFGGAIRGNFDHQFNLIGDQVVDLNRRAQDVQGIHDAYRHDPVFFGNPEHLDSLDSCLPRVRAWAEEFVAAHGAGDAPSPEPGGRRSGASSRPRSSARSPARTRHSQMARSG